MPKKTSMVHQPIPEGWVKKVSAAGEKKKTGRPAKEEAAAKKALVEKPEGPVSFNEALVQTGLGEFIKENPQEYTLRGVLRNYFEYFITTGRNPETEIIPKNNLKTEKMSREHCLETLEGVFGSNTEVKEAFAGLRALKEKNDTLPTFDINRR